MKLGLTYQEVGALFNADVQFDGVIDHVAIDSRTILSGSNTIFFAFKGKYRDGHEFIPAAYKSGVRFFIVSEQIDKNHLYSDAIFIQVSSSLNAIQKLAAYHRSKFDIPIIGITGSAGKTTVKEILGHLLQDRYRVVRSPKSYNSQLGVALSLFEITKETEIAVIEAGISHPNEMEQLEFMIRPTVGILTSIGTAHLENFRDRKELFNEKMKLFKDCRTVFTSTKVSYEFSSDKFIVIDPDLVANNYSISSEALVNKLNLSLSIVCAEKLGMQANEIRTRMSGLRPIAMRLETYEGIGNSIIINDTYNLDEEGLRAALDYQKSLAGQKKRLVYIGTSSEQRKEQVRRLVRFFEPIELFFADEKPISELALEEKIVLIKGDHDAKMDKLAASLRKQKHETFLEIDLNAIRDNIGVLKEKVPSNVKVLAMVKASSYGSGAERLAEFLERTGVSYLGVAYPDEGAELRKAGIGLPIMVMNVEQSSFGFCIEHDLEPAIFSLDQLDAFIRTLIHFDRNNYPIHIKLETGMNRLGFQEGELNEVIEMLRSQPEVRVKSVYSHLATADDPKSDLVEKQVQRFERLSAQLSEALGYSFLRHILNSEGVINYPQYHFDMVRIGIAMYGITNHIDLKNKLKPAIKWSTSISQIKLVKAGESIGYGGHASLDHDGVIAIIPVGYADGFRRILGNGNGGVVIQGHFCKTVGNVCMDMIMVDVTSLPITKSDPVEIIGEQQSLEEIAVQMETIPYEVLTGISKRVHRIYIES